jgi:hypothetical protein
MELNLILAVTSILALILSLGAFGFSLFAFIETQATKRSTHTVMPVGNEMSLQKLEEDIEKLTGQGASSQSLQRDLSHAGLDVDDLV